MSKPIKGEPIYVYLSVSTNAISAVLVREDNGRQHPVYYVSRTLLDAETRYSKAEQLALAVVMAAKKCRPYFQSHDIEVLSSYPLRSILYKPDLAGRLSKWVVKLSQFNITYKPLSAIKSQVLADFIADFSSDNTSNEVIVRNASVEMYIFCELFFWIVIKRDFINRIA